MNTQSASVLRKFEKVCEILDQYQHDSAKLIPIMQAVQEEYRYLPEEVLTYVATSLGIPASQVYGVATFYSHFALKPKGKYVIKI
jgi:NADH-quinone oxidoreductase subunit E